METSWEVVEGMEREGESDWCQNWGGARDMWYLSARSPPRGWDLFVTHKLSTYTRDHPSTKHVRSASLNLRRVRPCNYIYPSEWAGGKFLSTYFSVCVECCLCPNGITDSCMHERLACPSWPVLWNNRIADWRWKIETLNLERWKVKHWNIEFRKMEDERWKTGRPDRRSGVRICSHCRISASHKSIDPYQLTYIYIL